MIRATIPDQQSLRSASKTLSSRMLCAASPSRSKGSKQSRLRLIAADVTGCSLPANTSKKSRLEAGCKCESDELACAGACGAGSGLGLLWCVAGKAGVRAVRPGPCKGEHGSWVPSWGKGGGGMAARSCAGPRSGLFHVCLLWSIAGCFCWQPTMAHTWAKGQWSLVQLPVW